MGIIITFRNSMFFVIYEKSYDSVKKLGTLNLLESDIHTKTSAVDELVWGSLLGLIRL